MAIAINGTGTITGISVGGLNDSIITSSELANGAVTTAKTDFTGNLQFNSGYGSVATAYGVRAWIDFDGTAGTIGTGNGSGNMDAVTDNGTGDYTVNFTTDMPDNNYCPIITGTTISSGRLSSVMIKEATTLAVGGFTVTFKSKNSVSYVGWSPYDPVDVCIAVVR